MKRLLLADDDPGMRAALEERFRRGGWQVDLATNGADALSQFRRLLHPLVITDIRMPGCDGFALMREVRTMAPHTAVILLTAYGCVPDAVEAMRGGAWDYLVKPVSFEKLEVAVERVLERAQQQAPRTEILVGHTPLWLETLDRARRAAETDADILIEGESGTGKELIARMIHRLSSRNRGPFVALNCAAVPETLLESELFGHARGAFTGAAAAKPGKFEIASGGTLVLDEVGEMPLSLQPKLLRVLQEREFDRLGSNQSVHVDIRIIATTNRPLVDAVAGGRFRSDLYYRLNVIPLTLPPLRERRQDIEELAEHFTTLYRQPGKCHKLSPELLAELTRRDWPGNVRELANFIRRAVALAQKEVIGLEACDHAKAPSFAVPAAVWKPGLSFGEMERKLLTMTLEATGGNRSRAAAILGISLRTVRNKIREHGLPPRSHYVHD